MNNNSTARLALAPVLVRVPWRMFHPQGRTASATRASSLKNYSKIITVENDFKVVSIAQKYLGKDSRISFYTNNSDKARYITQVTYGKRLVGHKYYPFMNYQMPEHCYKNASPRLKSLLGFLPHGAYG